MEEPSGFSDGSLAHALTLAGYVAAQGGRMHPSMLSKFYEVHPEAKEALRGGVRAFCSNHPALLRFEGSGPGAGTIVSIMSQPRPRSTASSAPNSGQQPAAAKAGSGDERKVAELLCDFVARRGGRLAGSELPKFAAMHPEVGAAVRDAGLRKFCDRHPRLLRFEVDSKAGLVHSVGRPVVAAPPEDRPLPGAGAPGGASAGAGPAAPQGGSQGTPEAACDPQEVARELARFVAASSERISTEVIMKEFKSAHPEWRAVFKNGLRHFCAQHPELLQVDDGRLVCVPGMSKSQQAKAEIERAALLWKAHLDGGREHLIGASKESLQAEFRDFCEAQGLRGMYFGGVMRRLQQLGFQKHGTWAAAPASSSSSDASSPRAAQSDEGLGGDLGSGPQRPLVSATSEDPWHCGGGDPWSPPRERKPAAGPVLAAPGLGAAAGEGCGTPSTGVTSFLEQQQREGERGGEARAGGEPRPPAAKAPPEPAQSDSASTAPSQLGGPADGEVAEALRTGSLASQLQAWFAPLEASGSPVAHGLEGPYHAPGFDRSVAFFGSFHDILGKAKGSLLHAGQMYDAAEALAAAMHAEVAAREAQLRSREARLLAKERELLAREAEVTAREANSEARERAFTDRLEAAKLAVEAEISHRLAHVAGQEARLQARERRLA